MVEHSINSSWSFKRKMQSMLKLFKLVSTRESLLKQFYCNTAITISEISASTGDHNANNRLQRDWFSSSIK